MDSVTASCFAIRGARPIRHLPREQAVPSLREDKRTPRSGDAPAHGFLLVQQQIAAVTPHNEPHR